MTRKRRSAQRDLIYHYVKSVDCHPTAEMVYQALKDDSPGLSRGTVYRNLGILAQEGLLIRMPFPVERYDGNTVPHAHLICQHCGFVTDLSLDYESRLDEAVTRLYGCRIARHECYFYGQCAACVAAQPNAGKEDVSV